MKLIPNWQRVAARAHSMWAQYLALVVLLVPEIVFAVWGVDTNPRLWWWLAIALVAYGIIGRIKDQGIDR